MMHNSKSKPRLKTWLKTHEKFFFLFLCNIKKHIWLTSPQSVSLWFIREFVIHQIIICDSLWLLLFIADKKLLVHKGDWFQEKVGELHEYGYTYSVALMVANLFLDFFVLSFIQKLKRKKNTLNLLCHNEFRTRSLYQSHAC